MLIVCHLCGGDVCLLRVAKHHTDVEYINVVATYLYSAIAAGGCSGSL